MGYIQHAIETPNWKHNANASGL